MIIDWPTVTLILGLIVTSPIWIVVAILGIAVFIWIVIAILAVVLGIINYIHSKYRGYKRKKFLEKIKGGN